MTAPPNVNQHLIVESSFDGYDRFSVCWDDYFNLCTTIKLGLVILPSGTAFGVVHAEVDLGYQYSRHLHLNRRPSFRFDHLVAFLVQTF